MDLWLHFAVESLFVCVCGCGVMECECLFIGRCMCMLLSFREARMPIPRDFYHEQSLLVSSSLWHGQAMIRQQRTCTRCTLYKFKGSTHHFILCRFVCVAYCWHHVLCSQYATYYRFLVAFLIIIGFFCHDNYIGIPWYTICEEYMYVVVPSWSDRAIEKSSRGAIEHDDNHL